MLFASHLILNCCPAAGQCLWLAFYEECGKSSTDGAGVWRFHPWLHDPSNHVRTEDMLRTVQFPDINPAEDLPVRAQSQAWWDLSVTPNTK
jgi:hypothetical protein